MSDTLDDTVRQARRERAERVLAVEASGQSYSGLTPWAEDVLGLDAEVDELTGALRDVVIQRDEAYAYIERLWAASHRVSGMEYDDYRDAVREAMEALPTE